MNDEIFLILMGSVISLVGTMLGASLGIVVKKPSNKFLSIIIGFAAGLMLAVVVFELIPEAIEKWNFTGAILFSFMGVITIIFIEFLSDKVHFTANHHEKVALMVAVSLMLHNLPEGVIMGCGFVTGGTLGITMSIIIGIHDVPEGLAVAAPLMASKVKASKIMLYTFFTALPTVVGAWLGICIGGISTSVLGASLAFASGIMLYVVCGEMLPESSKLWEGVISTIGILIGIWVGLIMTNIL